MNDQNLNTEIKKNLANWREIVSQYQTPNNKRALVQILSTFIPFIALWILIYFTVQYSVWLSIPLFLLNAFFLVRIFIIQHDCGHHSYFRSKKLNNVIGTVCSVFSFIPFKYWSKVHNFHHGHSGQLEVRDIGDVPTMTLNEYLNSSWSEKLKYRIFRLPIVTFVIVPVYYFLVPCRYPTISFNKWGKYMKMMIKDNFWIGLSYFVVGTLVGWPMFLLIQLTLVSLFGVVAFWFFYVQHQHEFSYKEWKHNWDFLLSAIRGSSYYKLPKIFHWLTGNIGYHHIHHLSSIIPNYNLAKCSQEQPVLNKYVTKIDFWKSLKLIRNKLWDEEQGKMISFTEYRKIKKLRMAA
jgi:omega-6 fatty acid desaturase (delta-12 desaturase)